MKDYSVSAVDEIPPDLVRKRVAMARRNGFPAWLWPEIDVCEWRASLDAIEGVTRRILAGHSRVDLPRSDEKAMGIAGYTSGMGPLLGYWIESGVLGAPMVLEKVFRLHLFHNRTRMFRLAAVARDTLERLADCAVMPVVLKGMHTAFCHFPDPGVRPLSDIDVYIPASSMFAAELALSTMGFRRILRTRLPYACDWTLPSQRAEPISLTYVHQDDPWSIDVLGTLDKRLMTGATIKFDGLLPKAERAKWPVSNRISVMPQPLLTLYLAAHVSQMLLNTTLLRLTEMALVIRRDRSAGTLDWGEFLEGARAIGGARFVYPALVLCERLAPQTIPAEVLTAARADAPQNLRSVVERLTAAGAQPLDRHSVRERFMWAGNWRERLRQVVAEAAFDGRGRPIGHTLYSAGTKLWALRRRRYSA